MRPFVLAVVLILSAVPIFAAERDFVVAHDGNDDWSGTLDAANSAAHDGPFASLSRAAKAVRELKVKDQGRKRPVVVLLREGVYFLKEPWALTQEDSGSVESPVVYAAFPGEEPVVSGGKKLDGFIVNARGFWELTIPEVQRGEWKFCQLFVNGERRYRARLPKNGYFYIASGASPTPASAGKGYDRFHFSAGDITEALNINHDVEVLAFHNWNMSRLPISAVDEKSSIVTLAGRTCSKDDWCNLNHGIRYILDNTGQALSDAGEWYLDKKSGLLTYIPMPGERPEQAEVIAPGLDKVLQIKGDAKKKQWVEHLEFRGITFSHTNWILPAQGYSFGQAEAGMSAAVSAEFARQCAFDNCRITHTGGYAIELGVGCQHNRIENCEMTDLAAGGVKLGEMRGRPEPECAAYNEVRNNLIAHGGRIHPAAVGVFAGQTPFNIVEHNEICDFYYSSISVGWTWGYGASVAHHNTFAYNHLHDLGQGVLTDMGGIYSLGVSPGTVMHHNLIHDIESHSYGGWGIYFDEGSTGIVAENNIVYNMKSAGFHQHYGKENRVTNNIFAFSREAQLMRTRVEDHLSFTLDHNIVYWKEGPLLGSNWSGKQFELDYNIYWKKDGSALTFPKNFTLEQWQKDGHDIHSIHADPLFVDPEHFNFTLKPDSPALKLGFKPIDLTGVGRDAKKAVWRNPSTTSVLKVRAFPPPPPPPPPMQISEGFEESQPGERAPDAVANEENDKATVRISADQAATGKHSLKFQDRPGQKNRFDPFIYYQPHITNGITSGAFSLRLGEGAVFFHEWRDGGNPYKAGPSLRVDESNALTANGRKLVDLPRNQWIRIVISCGLGGEASGKYDLSITLPGDAEPRKFNGITCDPNFKALNWFGFVADADRDAVFYLDDVRLKNTVQP